jgi:hypothetical protein
MRLLLAFSVLALALLTSLLGGVNAQPTYNVTTAALTSACGNAYAVTVDPTTGVVYAACYGATSSNSIISITSAGVVTSLATATQCSYATSVAVRQGTVYATCSGGTSTAGSVISIAPGGTITTLATPAQCLTAYSVVVNATTGIVYAACYGATSSNSVLSITGTTVTSIATFNQCRKPISLALAGVLYVVCSDNNNGAVISITTGGTVTNLVTNTQCPSGNSVAVNPTTGTAYVACNLGTSNAIVSISGTTISNLATSTQCAGAYEVAVNPTTGTVYAACNSGTSYTVIGIAPGGGGVIANLITPTQCSTVYGLATNPATGMVYAACYGTVGSMQASVVSAMPSCSANTYFVASTGACVNCPAGQSSSAGATACTPCAAGSSSVSGGACTSCAGGTFAPAAGSATCTACSTGSISSAGATACTACTAGQYASGAACVPCPAGQSSTAGAGACTAASTGSAAVSLSPQLSCAGTWIAVNKRTGTAYIACYSGSQSILSITSANAVATLYVSACTPYGMDVVDATGTVYTSCVSGTAVVAINNVTSVNTVVTPSAPGIWKAANCTTALLGIAVNPLTGAVYSTCAGTGALTMFTTTGGVAILQPPCLTNGATATNAGTGVVYAACGTAVVAYSGSNTVGTWDLSASCTDVASGVAVDATGVYVACGNVVSLTTGVVVYNATLFPAYGPILSVMTQTVVASGGVVYAVTRAGVIAISVATGVVGLATPCTNIVRSMAVNAGGDLLTVCGVGTLTTLTRTTVGALACPSGTVRVGVTCASCPSGTYASGGVCVSCGVGTYAPAPGTSACLSCPSNQFTSAIGSSACTPCGANTWSLPGATACTACAPSSSSSTTPNDCTARTLWGTAAAPATVQVTTQAGMIIQPDVTMHVSALRTPYGMSPARIFYANGTLLASTLPSPSSDALVTQTFVGGGGIVTLEANQTYTLGNVFYVSTQTTTCALYSQIDQTRGVRVLGFVTSTGGGMPTTPTTSQNLAVVDLVFTVCAPVSPPPVVTRQVGAVLYGPGICGITANCTTVAGGLLQGTCSGAQCNAIDPYAACSSTGGCSCFSGLASGPFCTNAPTVAPCAAFGGSSACTARNMTCVRQTYTGYVGVNVTGGSSTVQVAASDICCPIGFSGNACECPRGFTGPGCTVAVGCSQPGVLGSGCDNGGVCLTHSGVNGTGQALAPGATRCFGCNAGWTGLFCDVPAPSTYKIVNTTSTGGGTTSRRRLLGIIEELALIRANMALVQGGVAYSEPARVCDCDPTWSWQSTNATAIGRGYRILQLGNYKPDLTISSPTNNLNQVLLSSITYPVNDTVHVPTTERTVRTVAAAQYTTYTDALPDGFYLRTDAVATSNGAFLGRAIFFVISDNPGDGSTNTYLTAAQKAGITAMYTINRTATVPAGACLGAVGFPGATLDPNFYAHFYATQVNSTCGRQVGQFLVPTAACSQTTYAAQLHWRLIGHIQKLMPNEGCVISTPYVEDQQGCTATYGVPPAPVDYNPTANLTNAYCANTTLVSPARWMNVSLAADGVTYVNITRPATSSGFLVPGVNGQTISTCSCLAPFQPTNAATSTDCQWDRCGGATGTRGYINTSYVTPWNNRTASPDACVCTGVWGTDPGNCTATQCDWCNGSACKNGGTVSADGTKCECTQLYYGAFCQYTTCNGTNMVLGSVGGVPYCHCTEAWTGANCTQPACSSQGAWSYEYNECVCQGGFTGAQCEISTCAEGHGFWDASLGMIVNGTNATTGGCSCYPPWTASSNCFNHTCATPLAQLPVGWAGVWPEGVPVQETGTHKWSCSCTFPYTPSYVNNSEYNCNGDLCGDFGTPTSAYTRGVTVAVVNGAYVGPGVTPGNTTMLTYVNDLWSRCTCTQTSISIFTRPENCVDAATCNPCVDAVCDIPVYWPAGAVQYGHATVAPYNPPDSTGSTCICPVPYNVSLPNVGCKIWMPCGVGNNSHSHEAWDETTGAPRCECNDNWIDGPYEACSVYVPPVLPVVNTTVPTTPDGSGGSGSSSGINTTTLAIALSSAVGVLLLMLFADSYLGTTTATLAGATYEAVTPAPAIGKTVTVSTTSTTTTTTTSNAVGARMRASERRKIVKPRVASLLAVFVALVSTLARTTDAVYADAQFGNYMTCERFEQVNGNVVSLNSGCTGTSPSASVASTCVPVYFYLGSPIRGTPCGGVCQVGWSMDVWRPLAPIPSTYGGYLAHSFAGSSGPAGGGPAENIPLTGSASTTGGVWSCINPNLPSSATGSCCPPGEPLCSPLAQTFIGTGDPFINDATGVPMSVANFSGVCYPYTDAACKGPSPPTGKYRIMNDPFTTCYQSAGHGTCNIARDSGNNIISASCACTVTGRYGGSNCQYDSCTVSNGTATTTSGSLAPYEDPALPSLGVITTQCSGHGLPTYGVAGSVGCSNIFPGSCTCQTGWGSRQGIWDNQSNLNTRGLCGRQTMHSILGLPCGGYGSATYGTVGTDTSGQRITSCSCPPGTRLDPAGSGVCQQTCPINNVTNTPCGQPTAQFAARGVCLPLDGEGWNYACTCNQGWNGLACDVPALVDGSGRVCPYGRAGDQNGVGADGAIVTNNANGTYVNITTNVTVSTWSYLLDVTAKLQGENITNALGQRSHSRFSCECDNKWSTQGFTINPNTGLCHVPCSAPMLTGANQKSCSGNGVCVLDSGWIHRMNSDGYWPLTAGNGSASNNDYVCQCAAGWSGPACATPILVDNKNNLCGGNDTARWIPGSNGTLTPRGKVLLNSDNLGFPFKQTCQCTAPYEVDPASGACRVPIWLGCPVPAGSAYMCGGQTQGRCQIDPVRGIDYQCQCENGDGIEAFTGRDCGVPNAPAYVTTDGSGALVSCTAHGIPDPTGTTGFCVCEPDYTSDACEVYIGNRACGSGQSYLDTAAANIVVRMALVTNSYILPAFGAFDGVAYAAAYPNITCGLGAAQAFVHYTTVGKVAGFDAFIVNGAHGQWNDAAYLADPSTPANATNGWTAYLAAVAAGQTPPRIYVTPNGGAPPVPIGIVATACPLDHGMFDPVEYAVVNCINVTTTTVGAHIARPTGVDPWTHYVTIGYAQGRQLILIGGAHGVWNDSAYLAANPDVTLNATVTNGFVHYVLYGYAQGRAAWIVPNTGIVPYACGWFNPVAYVASNCLASNTSDVAAFAHYVTIGYPQGRDLILTNGVYGRWDELGFETYQGDGGTYSQYIAHPFPTRVASVLPSTLVAPQPGRACAECSCGAFNATAYAAANCLATGVDPFTHWNTSGRLAGVDAWVTLATTGALVRGVANATSTPGAMCVGAPSPTVRACGMFDTNAYAVANCISNKTAAFSLYVSVGYGQARHATLTTGVHGVFDGSAYARNNPSIGAVDPWTHYSTIGRAAGLAVQIVDVQYGTQSPACGAFDPVGYGVAYGVATAQAWNNYVTVGYATGYDIYVVGGAHGLFDPVSLLRENPGYASTSAGVWSVYSAGATPPASIAAFVVPAVSGTLDGCAPYGVLATLASAPLVPAIPAPGTLLTLHGGVRGWWSESGYRRAYPNVVPLSATPVLAGWTHFITVGAATGFRAYLINIPPSYLITVSGSSTCPA